jgi:hypothetical protein
MRRSFDGIRAPSTFGTFLRSFTFGHLRQLDSVAASFQVRLARATPLLPGADAVAVVDIDDTVRETHGYAKQGVGFGYSGVKGLNALVATVSTPLAAPAICGTRLRKGSTNSARGAGRFLANALVTARAAGAGGRNRQGLVLLRADSALFTPLDPPHPRGRRDRSPALRAGTADAPGVRQPRRLSEAAPPRVR